MLNSLERETGTELWKSRSRRDHCSPVHQKSLLERWNYLKACNGRRCFSADAEKEVPGKPIECSFKQNPDRQITEIFFLGGHFWEVEEERNIMEFVGVISKQSSLPSKTQRGGPLEENAS